MAIIKKSEFKSMGANTLQEKLSELRKQLMKVNTQVSTHTVPENPGKVRELKKTISRIIMFIDRKNKENKEPKVNAKKNEKAKATREEKKKQ